LYFLSGITCTEQNFIQKSGFQEFASKNQIAVVVPDTSPRGENIPDDENYKLGCGAGFYLNATQEPWSQNYNMYDYITKELPNIITNNFKFSNSKVGIFGHSMGGGGAIQCALKNDLYKSVSAFSPICSLQQSSFAKKMFSRYLNNDEKELDNLKINFENHYILEKLVKLKKEISVIITRFGPQEYEIYDPIENVHEDQILKYSKTPAEINENLFNQSKEWAIHIAEELGYIGSMCVEYFIDKNENLYVNEIAPRVHNSGHLTINAYNVSQFENHIRAVCGLDKIETKKLYNAKMINLIGEDILVCRNKKFKDNEFFFDYLKNTVKKKRKMGHLTIIEK